MAGMEKGDYMNRDKMVVLDFPSNHEDEPNVDFSFGPCTEEEGNALVELLNTKYKENENDLIEKLFDSGIINQDTRSWGGFARAGFSASVMPAFSAEVSEVIKLLGS